MFYLAGGAAIVLGLYSLTLPHTPPPAAGKDISLAEVAGLGALKLLTKPSFLVFILCSFRDLHSACVLLSACRAMRHTSRHCRSDFQDDFWTNVRNLFHVGYCRFSFIGWA